MKREWLIQIRVSKQLTQVQVASFAFIDRGYYSQIETGKRNPSQAVASNIAKALNFDPLLFFQDKNERQTINMVSGEILEFFSHKDLGEVQYLYNNLELHNQHCISYILTGVKKNSYCIMIDDEENILSIKQGLENMLDKEVVESTICFINREKIRQVETDTISRNVQELLSRFSNSKSIRIWTHEEVFEEHDWLYKLGYQVKTKKNSLNKYNILFLRAYNATLVKAATHIRMMRNYPYLMTDYEIVESPFYQFSNKPAILPSLFIQEKM